MYSQYQYQQHPQYQTQQNRTWNGQSWVPTTQQQPQHAATHSTYHSANQSQSRQQQPQHHQPQQHHDTQLSPKEMTEKYTAYYHGWKAKEEQDRRRATASFGDARTNAESHVTWSEYNAMESSRVAHHFNSTPHMPYPHKLPPAPPASFLTSHQSAESTNSLEARSVVTPARTPINRSSSSSPTNRASAGPSNHMKDYFHRCLSQCSDKASKEEMQKQFQAIMTQAYRDGALHTTDWANRPLLPVPTLVSSSSSLSRRKYNSEQNVGSDGRQHGSLTPVPSNTLVSSSSSSYPDKLASSRDVSNPKTPSSSYNSQSNSDNAGYYGPTKGSRQPNAWSNGAGSGRGTDQQKDSYYGPSSSRTKRSGRPSFEKKPSTEEAGYYGPAGGDSFNEESSVTSKSSSLGEYVVLNGGANRKTKKKQKSQQAKKKLKKSKTNVDDGFERSSNALARRANRFSDTPHSTGSALSNTSAEFGKYMGVGVIGGLKKLDEGDYERLKVKGTCTTLEKKYLRLTAKPRPELVRPPPILAKHLQNLKDEWGSPNHRDYLWFCSQLKAIRQDLTVQQISSAFAVDVYESHARIALEEGDLNEYNQCQTQLKELYAELKSDPRATKNENEFVAYRLIYYVFLTGNKKYEEGSTDLFKIMLMLSTDQRKDPSIAHALKVRMAVAEFDYHSFFRLLRACPKHGKYLMKSMIPNVRKFAIQRVCKAYRPSISVSFVLDELGFEKENYVKMKEGRDWLESCGCVLKEDLLLTKESVVREAEVALPNSLI